MRIVFEYMHLYIRMQTNIHKNEKPYLFAAIEVEEITSNQQRWVRWVLKCLHFTFWAHDYLCRWAHDYLYRLIPVEFGDRSCPYKVKWRSGFQIVRYHSTNISIRIRDPIVVNTFVFTTYCIRESPSYMWSCTYTQFGCSKLLWAYTVYLQKWLNCLSDTYTFLTTLIIIHSSLCKARFLKIL